ncbi:hypothetical protein OG562_21885 [Streptomyces sp. NBC_01275]|uniref:protealysin inhibitor emfourin n=1 Tax=Streptomyces sp. NBC_01275 TaxID=2903807 RepID=UPI002250FD1C|nr:protealysin inhibitor emfourin [Streptomyces sp. NBC_01275]MCX4763566.1 hypothetical protein [Streptomyces sp. NBC_01275]
MRIRVTRSGGLLPVPRWAELDTSGRPDGADLERLAREVLTTTPPGPTPGVPDGYHYTLTVEADGTAADRTVEFADPRLTAVQVQLVERVLGEGA